ncbi:MAG: alpha/beta hydrolase [Sandaracinobacter sp.]
MRHPLVAAALLAAAPLLAQPAGGPDLPRLMNPRSVMSLPAAVPSETLTYGGAPSQKIELFLPPPNAENPEALRPVVVLIHGGCWQQKVAGMELVRPAAGAFLEKGFAVWSITYRRIDEEGGGYPGTFRDVGAAIDALRDHAEAKKLDLNRVVLWGHSAGGHLALWAAGRHKLPADSPLRTENPLRPRGVVSVGGFGSLQKWESEIRNICGADSVPKLAPSTTADGTERTADQRFADTSPERLLPTGVPAVMLHGVFDYVAFPAIGLEHAQDGRKAGDRVDIQIAPIAGHFEVIAPGTAAFTQGLAAVERFAR